MWRRSDCGWRRKCSRSGCRVSGGDNEAPAHARRSAGLVENMSRYLIRRIEETPTIVIWPHTEIVGLEGGDHLESVRWRNSQTEQTEEHKIRHVFVMTGAAPNTSGSMVASRSMLKDSLRQDPICRQKI